MTNRVLLFNGRADIGTTYENVPLLPTDAPGIDPQTGGPTALWRVATIDKELTGPLRVGFKVRKHSVNPPDVAGQDAAFFAVQYSVNDAIWETFPNGQFSWPDIPTDEYAHIFVVYNDSQSTKKPI